VVLSERLGLGVLPGVRGNRLRRDFSAVRVLPEWETLLVGAWLVVLCVLTVPCFRAPASWKHSLLLGFLWGMALLTNPICVLLLLAWPHFASSGNAPDERSRARRAMLVVLAGAALVCLPWVVRNYRQFHAIFFMRNNLGLELAVSNNPCARPTLLENIFRLPPEHAPPIRIRPLPRRFLKKVKWLITGADARRDRMDRAHRARLHNRCAVRDSGFRT
jgi:4-amino-4-deoxy-L-arabinose transferase-like glycosyltransferase